MPNKDTRNQYHNHSFRKSYSFGKPSVKVMMSTFSFQGDGERKLCEARRLSFQLFCKMINYSKLFKTLHNNDILW